MQRAQGRAIGNANGYIGTCLVTIQGNLAEYAEGNDLGVEVDNTEWIRR